MSSSKIHSLNDNHSTEILLDNQQTLNPKTKTILRQDLFDSNKIFRLLLRFVLPALLVTFFQAMYIFSDQIMMVKFIPKSSLNPNGLTLEKLFDENILVPYWAAIGGSSNGVQPVDLVRSAISISAPITLILTASTLLVSMGIAVSFAKSLGKKDVKQIESVWSTGFISNVVIGLVISFFIFGISSVWLESSAKGTFPSDHDNIAIKNFNEAAQNVQVNLAQGYVYILCGFNIFQIMSQMYYFLSQSEGRQVFISIVPTFCNVLNILLDWILIVFGMLGLLGSALATAIGWVINFAAYVGYNLILTKKQQTNLLFRNLRFKLFSWQIFNLMILIGIASFLRNATSSFSNSMFQTYLVTMTNSTGYAIQHNVSPNVYQSYFGSVSPISNLAIQSVWGLIQGGRTIASYKYGREDYAAIKKIYWYVFLMAVIYGIVIYFLFAFALDNIFLVNLFDVASANLSYTTFLLRITLLQSVFLAIGTTGQLYFQSTQRIGFSWFVAILQNIIVFIPLLFTFQIIGNNIAGINPTFDSSQQAMDFFIWLLPISTIIASVINVIISMIHMYTRMGKYENEVKQNLRKPSKLMHR